MTIFQMVVGVVNKKAWYAISLCVLVASLLVSCVPAPSPTLAPSPQPTPSPSPSPSPSPTATPGPTLTFAPALTSTITDIVNSPSAFNGKTVVVSGMTTLKNRMPRLLIDGKGGINISGNIPETETDFFSVRGVYEASSNTIDVTVSTKEEIKYLTLEDANKSGANLAPVAVQGTIASMPKEVTSELKNYLTIPGFPAGVLVYPYVLYTLGGMYLTFSDIELDLPGKSTVINQGKYYTLAFIACEMKGVLIKTPLDKISFGASWQVGEFSGIIIAKSVTPSEPVRATVREINAEPEKYAFKRLLISGDYLGTTSTIEYSDIKAAPMGQGILTDRFNELFKEDTKAALETIEPGGKVWQMRRGKVTGTVLYPTGQVLKYLDYSAPLTMAEAQEKKKTALFIESFVDDTSSILNISDINPVYIKPSVYWDKVVELDGYTGPSLTLKNIAESVLKTELPVRISLTAVGISDRADVTPQIAVIGLGSELLDSKGQIVKGKFRFKLALSQSLEELSKGIPSAETAFFLLSRKEAPVEIKTYNLYINIDPAGAGSVNPPGGKYQAGSGITLTAAPAAGYIFDHWSGDASGTSPSVTVVLISDKGVTAHFRFR